MQLARNCAIDREQERWDKNAVIYAIDVLTFRDSNGDGMGDLAGVEARLECLAGLSEGMGKEVVTLHNLLSKKPRANQT
jgi:hypothetical protein